ncbi:MAG: 23S rRNA (guanosine(2251)-2'-O)-methyltransferase RlmB [Nitrospinota bacterium]
MLCGVHAVLAALEAGRRPLRRIFLAPGRAGAPAARILELARGRGVSVERAGAERLFRIAGTEGHQGIVALGAPLPECTLEELAVRSQPPAGPLLVLDNIQDPRNLGALLRTGAGLGASGALLTERRSAAITAVTAKAAAGALEYLPLGFTPNLARALGELGQGGLWRVAADPEEGEELGRFRFPQPLALVLGSEGKGVRPLVRKSCDGAVKIPMACDMIGSLNVVVAAGIALYEAARQRGEAI